MTKAFITGIAGQDGSYLAELLLGKGYEVWGLVNDTAAKGITRIRHIQDRLKIRAGDVRDKKQIFELVKEIKPDETYHLASLVEPRILLEKEAEIFDINFLSTHHLLQAIKLFSPQTRFFLASSSMVFGVPEEFPQTERTPLRPKTPYGIAKAASQQLVQMYREMHEIFACSGILYNHESPRRDFHFLPRKITSGAARIKAGIEKELVLGDLDSQRDWGFAGDYVEAMWLMMQASEAIDYLIGTGESHSIQELLDIAFGHLNLNWSDYVKSDPSLSRKGDVVKALVPDISKIRERLGWRPRHSFRDLVIMMVEEDVKLTSSTNFH